jgi:hypothetical protein
MPRSRQSAPILARSATLRARIGDRLDEHQPRARRDRGGDVGHVGGVDERQRRAVLGQRVQHAVGVAEHVVRRDDMIVGLQQRDQDRADCRHAGGEAHAGDTILHRRDLRFQRRGRRVALPPVRVTLRAPLEHRRQLARVPVAIGHRDVQRLVQRAVLDRRVAVGMQDSGREPAL